MSTTIMSKSMRLIVGISGASGIIYAITLLRMARYLAIETHLVSTPTAEISLAHETNYKISTVRAMADIYYKIDDMTAPIASGTFQTIGMVIAPCSIRSLSEIATGTTSNLLTRAADVILKERRKLALIVRETPLHSGHLRTMLTVSKLGGIIVSPAPAFYIRPQSLDDVITHTTARVLDLFGFNINFKRWGKAQFDNSIYHNYIIKKQ